MESDDKPSDPEASFWTPKVGMKKRNTYYAILRLRVVFREKSVLAFEQPVNFAAQGM
jgi:hypothetical protein